MSVKSQKKNMQAIHNLVSQDLGYIYGERESGPNGAKKQFLIVRGIEFPDGVTTNLLDPCCGCGLALRMLAQGNNSFTYGVELDRYRAEEAQGRLHRVGFGSYFHSRVSHEAFHVLLLNPPYLWTLTEGSTNTRSEKRFLVDSLCHLMYGGLLIYIIPLLHPAIRQIKRSIIDLKLIYQTSS